MEFKKDRVVFQVLKWTIILLCLMLVLFCGHLVYNTFSDKPVEALTMKQNVPSSIFSDTINTTHTPLLSQKVDTSEQNQKSKVAAIKPLNGHRNQEEPATMINAKNVVTGGNVMHNGDDITYNVKPMQRTLNDTIKWRLINSVSYALAKNNRDSKCAVQVSFPADAECRNYAKEISDYLGANGFNAIFGGSLMTSGDAHGISVRYQNGQVYVDVYYP